QLGGNTFWFAAERARTFVQIFPSAQFSSTLPEVEPTAPSREAALLALVTGWMGHAGPITSAQLASVLALPVTEIDKALLRLEASGLILRGKFTPASNQPMHPNAPTESNQTEPNAQTDSKAQTEWCERRLLARIHRLTLGQLRKQIEAVTPAQFMSWLLRWQHIAPGAQQPAHKLRGRNGLNLFSK